MQEKENRLAQPGRKSRDARYELLRVACMLLIITSHGLSYSTSMDNLIPWTANYYLIWFLRHLCRVSVTGFVMVNGYFMCLRPQPLRLRKITVLWLQTATWAVVIYLFLCAVGERSFGKANLLRMLLPIFSRRYWFVTCYVLLLLWTPVLNRAIAALDRKQHLTLLLALLLIYCVAAPQLVWMSSKDVTDVNGGQSTVFFIVVYILAAYLRKYRPEPRFSRWWQNVLLYAGLTLAATVLSLVMYRFQDHIPESVYTAKLFYWKNDILLVLAAVAFFRVFQCVRIPEGRLSAFVCKVSSLIFGVYLVHDHTMMRTPLWKHWTHLGDRVNSAALWPWLVGLVLGVLCAGLVLELVRQTLCKPLEKAVGRLSDRFEAWCGARVDRWLDRT